MNLYQQTAHQLHDLGLNVTAIKAGEKRPGHLWEQWQTTEQTLDDVNRLPWLQAGGVGVLSGVNHFRVFDFDACADMGPAVKVLNALGLDSSYPWFWRSGSGAGWGIAVLCEDDPPVLAELDGRTNGKGPGVFTAPGRGFDHLELRWRDCQTVLPPSTHPAGPGYRWQNGAPTNPPAWITPEQAVRAFQTVTIPKATQPRTEPPAQTFTRNQDAATERAGDEFARTHDWADILEPHGWRVDHVKGKTTFWTRPGKDDGTSAATGGDYDPPVLWVWSTNAAPFQPGESYTKWGAHTLLNHGGDFTAAARAIYAAREPAAGNETTHGAQTSTTAGAQPGAGGEKVSRRKVRGADLVKFLEDLGYTFRLNLTDDSVEVNGERVTDVLRAKMRTQLRDAGFGKYLTAAEDAWTAHAAHQAYHPVRAYLEGLRYDGYGHIAMLAAHVEDKHQVFATYLRKWLIGSVARAYTGCQNAVLVLDGAQGIGKSQFARWLCPIPKLFVDSGINPDDKDCSLLALRSWIWEVSELGATTRRSDVEALKGFLSREQFTLRPAYGHYEIVKPGLASFIGTVNDAGGVFADSTGSRRFWATTLTRLDWAYTRLDIDQVWAEAYTAFRAGESWRLLPEEAAKAQKVNEAYQVKEPIEDYLRKYFHVDPTAEGAKQRDEAYFTPTVEILQTLHMMGYSGNVRATQMALAATLKRLQLEDDRVNGVRGYWGVWARLLPTLPTSANLS